MQLLICDDEITFCEQYKDRAEQILGGGCRHPFLYRFLYILAEIAVIRRRYCVTGY